MENGWNVLQVIARSETRVASSLRLKGYECFVPLCARDHKGFTSQRVSAGALFPGYVFCCLEYRTSGLAVTTPGVLRVVSFGGTAVVIGHEEMAAIKRCVELEKGYGPHPYLPIGKKAEVIGGPLRGIKGLVVRTKRHCRIVLSIQSLIRSMYVEVDAGLLTSDCMVHGRDDEQESATFECQSAGTP